MTGLTPLIGKREERTHARSIWIGAGITTACVAVASTAALLTLPSVTGSVTDVATSYIEARVAGNHLEAWNLECESTRSSVGSYDGYLETVTHFDKFLKLPDHVKVRLGDLHSDPFGFTIATTVTSADPGGRTIAGELPLSFEDGRFRVCDDGLGPLGLL
jgi:hypothetical protein